MPVCIRRRKGTSWKQSTAGRTENILFIRKETKSPGIPKSSPDEIYAPNPFNYSNGEVLPDI